MNNRNFSLIGITALTFLLVCSSICTPVTATVVWSDDFGDGNLDGWTILEGFFETPSGPKYALTAEISGLNMIYHASSQVHGTWLLEMHEDRVAESNIEILFITTGTTLEDFEGYSMYLEYGLSRYGITLCRWNYSSTYDRSARFILAQHTIWTTEVIPPDTGWYIYNITRTDSGDIFISRGFDLIISSTPASQEWEFDDTIDTSDKFVVKTVEGGSIDTVIVGTDLPPIPTTTTPATSTTTNTYPTTTVNTGLTDPVQFPLFGVQIIAIAGAGVILVIGAVFLTKRR